MTHLKNIASIVIGNKVNLVKSDPELQLLPALPPSETPTSPLTPIEPKKLLASAQNGFFRGPSPTGNNKPRINKSRGEKSRNDRSRRDKSSGKN